MLACRRTSKSQLEKVSKSSHFRSNNRRQISLDLSHACRYRKRLISLASSQTYLKIIRLTRCEYSEHICVVLLSYLLNHVPGRVSLYPRGVSMYSKGCLPILILYIYDIQKKKKEKNPPSSSPSPPPEKKKKRKNPPQKKNDEARRRLTTYSLSLSVVSLTLSLSLSLSHTHTKINEGSNNVISIKFGGKRGNLYILRS